MIVCDRCLKARVPNDGDLCRDCKKEIIPLVQYLKDYKELIEQGRISVPLYYTVGLKGHIITLEAQETGSKHCGQG